jgi:hypothetical protein
MQTLKLGPFIIEIRKSKAGGAGGGRREGKSKALGEVGWRSRRERRERRREREGGRPRERERERGRESRGANTYFLN